MATAGARATPGETVRHGNKKGRVAFEFAQRLVLRECHTLNAIELLNPMPTLIQEAGISWHNVDWKSLGVVDQLTRRMELAVLYYWLQRAHAQGVSGEPKDRIKYIEDVGKEQLTAYNLDEFHSLRPLLDDLFTVETAGRTEGANIVNAKLKKATQSFATVFSLRYAFSRRGRAGTKCFATVRNDERLLVFDSGRGETSVSLSLLDIEYQKLFARDGFHISGAVIWALTPKPMPAATAATSRVPTPQPAATATASQSYAPFEPPLPDDLLSLDFGSFSFGNFDLDQIDFGGAAFDPPSAKRPRWT